MSKSILNYTTQIPVEKTLTEISKLLYEAGATAILTEFDQVNDVVSSVSFKLLLDNKNIAFQMPCRWESVLEILNDSNLGPRYKTNQQAVRVAWRIIGSWLKAQLAIIQTNMAKPEEVFLPYEIMRNGKTTFQNRIDNKLLLE